MNYMTETTLADLLPYLELYDEEDGDFSQYEPVRHIQLYVKEFGEVVEVGSLDVLGDSVTFRNIGGGKCGTAKVNHIECAVMEQKRII
jgi:hypothetical protein